MSDIDWAERAKMLEDMDTIDKLVTEIERLQARVKELEKLEGELRNAHFEGYMAGVGDSEDYDHDAIVMEKEAWKEYLAPTEQEGEG
jgi:hypothetical protein